MKTKAHVVRISILGLGLIGGSIAKSIKAQALPYRVVAYDPNEASLKQAQSDGVITEGFCQLAKAVDQAELIIIATPINQIEMLFQQLRHQASVQAVITDVAGVKQGVIAAAKRQLGQTVTRFVPGHPIAGKEHHGYEAASAGLFTKHQMILTPLPETEPSAFQKVHAFWQDLNTEIIQMSAEHHDTLLAATSHLPHLLAYALMERLANSIHGHEIFSYAAGGLRDFTRIAASDPDMWRDISFANRQQLMVVLDDYMDALQDLKQALQANDQSHVERVYRDGKAAKDHFNLVLHQRLKH